MCGITGIVSTTSIDGIALIKKMNESLVHRGPDGSCEWQNQSKTVHLGHTRLSIITTNDQGKQPKTYNDRYTITFNGEIYNYIELRDELQKKGYIFTTQTDTEVLLAMYAEYGKNCLYYLDGQFAFAVFDKVEKVVFCARDRFGEKPFYYTIYNDVLYFASEMKALWAAGISRLPNYNRVYNYLNSNLLIDDIDNPQATYYSHIFQLQHAHCFTIKTETPIVIKQEIYWQLDATICNKTIPINDAIEQYKILFEQSIDRRLRADASIGSSLSGGLDSAAIFASIKKIKGKNTTLSACFSGYEKDETEYIKMLTCLDNVTDLYCYPSAQAAADSFEKMMYHQEEPIGSFSVYAQWCVMQLAKQNNIRVLLDGQGADETMAGYQYYFSNYFRELMLHNPIKMKHELASFEQLYGSAFRVTNKMQLQTKFPWAAKKIGQLKNKFTFQPNFLNNDFCNQYAHQLPYPMFDSNNLNQTLHFATLQGGLQQLLRYSDRNSMAHSCEVRMPFLSHLLVEFVFSLPSEYKIQNSYTKYTQRKTFENILPDAIVWRKDKIGFEPPQKAWLQNKAIKEMTRQAILKLEANAIIKKNYPLTEEQSWIALSIGQLIQ